MNSEPPCHSGQGKPLDDILAEYLLAAEAGEALPRQELLARYPDLAQELEVFFQGRDRFDRLVAPLRVLGIGQDSVAADPRTVTDKSLALPYSLGDFRILREIGRGGMGVVYEAEQQSLGRRVALKVLPLPATMDPRHLQRFQNEARAAAALEHPHIVPVYGVGCERGVHYFAMKFIEGRSLAELLADRGQGAGPGVRPAPETPSSEEPKAPRAPAAATQPVAAGTTQAVARAGDDFRGMAAWGVEAAEALEYAHSLGIVHRDIKPANLLVDACGTLWVTDFGLARVGGDAGLTRTGDLVGTLRYMSPEQALAKHGLVDHHTDVYSLGATLYELLAGRPAVEGQDRQEILKRIAEDEPRPLDRAIPAELEVIVLKALEKEPAERYSTAQELADDLRCFLEDRPIRAKRPGVLARLRKWVRRRQAVVVTATLGFLVAVATLAGAVGWVMGDRAARRVETERAVSGALEKAHALLQEDKWAEALAAARRAEGLAEGDLELAKVRHHVQELLVDLEMAKAVEEIRIGQAIIRGDFFEFSKVDAAYAKAFRDYGIDVEARSAGEAGAWLGSRAIRVQLVGAVDEWAAGRMMQQKPGFKHLLAVARAADPDEWRNRLREAVGRGDLKALRELEASPRLDNVPASMWLLLGRALRVKGGDQAGLSLLRKVQQRHPGDFWINLDLAAVLHNLNPPRLEEAVGFYRAALALRPDSPLVHNNLGVALAAKGEMDDAIACFREAIRLKRNYADAHVNLGLALINKGAMEEGIALYKEAIRLNPDELNAYYNLGNALTTKGALEEALACYRKAIRLKPGEAKLHTNLGIALAQKGALDEAIACFQEAIRCQPDLAKSHYNLGIALRSKGALAEAVAAYKESIRLQPGYAMAHNDLGLALTQQGKVDEAMICFQEAIRLQPDYAAAHHNLGDALKRKGALAQAIACYKEAIRLKPDLAIAHLNLADALRQQGQFAAGLPALRRGHELGSRDPRWRLPTAQWIRECEELIALDARLTQVLAGKAQPGSARECLALAALCVQYKQLPAAAERWYAAAFAAAPDLAGDLGAGHRYNAACAAALAGCGQGKDAANLDDKERARLRRQALDWLRTDLTAWGKLLEKDTERAAPGVGQKMRLWQHDTSFDGVRIPEALAKLPGAERQEWQRLWQDVAALARRAADSQETAGPQQPRKGQERKN